MKQLFPKKSSIRFKRLKKLESEPIDMVKGQAVPWKIVWSVAIVREKCHMAR